MDIPTGLLGEGAVLRSVAAAEACDVRMLLGEWDLTSVASHARLVSQQRLLKADSADASSDAIDLLADSYVRGFVAAVSLLVDAGEAVARAAGES